MPEVHSEVVSCERLEEQFFFIWNRCCKPRDSLKKKSHNRNYDTLWLCLSLTGLAAFFSPRAWACVLEKLTKCF